MKPKNYSTDWIKEGLKRPGLSQAGLARAMGIDAAAVSRLLSGDRQLKAGELKLIWEYFKVPPVAIEAAMKAFEDSAAVQEQLGVLPAIADLEAAIKARLPDGRRFLAAKHSRVLPEDLAVCSTSENAKGEMLINREMLVDVERRPGPLSAAQGAFACSVRTDEMAPAYERGDLIFVNPDRPARVGNDCLFVGAVSDDGWCETKLGRLTEITVGVWSIVQHRGAARATLSRTEWPHALVIMAKYNSL